MSGDNNQTDPNDALERKLDLLEARFTMPLVVVMASPETAGRTRSNAPGEAAPPDPHHLFSSSRSDEDLTATLLGTTDHVSPPTFTGLPPLHHHSQHSILNNHTTASQHSFGFDTPSLSLPSIQHSSTGSNFPATTRSAGGLSTTTTSSSSRSPLAAVQEATTKHLRRIAAVAAVKSEKVFEIPAADDHSSSSNSRTMLMANIHLANAMAEGTEAVKKRKSVPTKSERVTVQENRKAAPAKNAKAESEPPASPDKERKRARAAKNNQASSSQPPPLPPARQIATQGALASSSSPPPQEKKTRKGTHSPLSAPGKSAVSAPGARGTQSSHLAGNGHHNNKSLHDFFVKKPRPLAMSDKVNLPLPANNSTFMPTPSASATDPVPNVMNFSSAVALSSQEGATITRHYTAEQDWPKEVEALRSRCQELEQLCTDKDEQLKAVSNTRTIAQAALKQALSTKEKELASLKQQQQSILSQARSELESWIRSAAWQESVQLRERLAADGARLGRIVTSRAGLRSVETWEEGHAAKQLKDKRTELEQKRLILQARYDASVVAAQQIRDQGEVEPEDQEKTAPVVGGMAIRTSLDAAEAKESAWFHLCNIARDEKEISLQEQRLNDEKVAHIRALKRVACEDSSRFRTRPKLHDRYVLRSLLGKGGFSEVWNAYDLVDHKEVAVKIHQLDPRWSDSKKENYTKHVSREYEIHRNVRHPRIVSLLDVFEIDNNSFATVLECCSGNDLDSLLKERRRLPERDARAILLQILSGMNYLSHPSPDGSRPGIIHYDLKPGNILFDEFGDAKITDFGLSKILDSLDSGESMELTSQGAGTYWYLPPECFVLEDDVRISNKVDVWSIGVIFYQMLFGKRPFGDGQSQDKLIADRTMLNDTHQVFLPETPEISDECKDFIRACLTYDQALRPTMAQLCRSPYVLSKTFSSNM